MTRRRIFFALFLLALSTPGSVFAADDPSGTYRFEGANPDGKKYEGTATITKLAQTYQVQWFFDGELGAMGVGVLKDKSLAVIFQTRDGGIGLSLYQIKGDKLEGTWTSPGADLVAPETLIKTGAAPKADPKPATTPPGPRV